MLPPLEDESIVSLGEGGTPLVSFTIEGRSVYGKLEYFSPTGSFKDRGTTVLVSLLKEVDIKTVVEDSSGNAAASLAAYCARAGINAKIFAPAHASPTKLAQIKVFGVELHAIQGNREEVASAAQAAAIEDYYASHVSNPLGLEGLKTFAYELWEELGRAPDAIVFPVGNGTLLRGAHKGFCELREANLIEKIPSLFAVQAELVAPLNSAWTQDHAQEDPAASSVTRTTIAEGIAVARPAQLEQILHCLRNTHGHVITVTEDEIHQAHTEMARQGFFIEPTSAAAVAGFKKLNKELKRDDLVVIPLTGSGLKSPVS
jgi:threonine synthase